MMGMTRICSSCCRLIAISTSFCVQSPTRNGWLTNARNTSILSRASCKASFQIEWWSSWSQNSWPPNLVTKCFVKSRKVDFVKKLESLREYDKKKLRATAQYKCITTLPKHRPLRPRTRSRLSYRRFHSASSCRESQEPAKRPGSPLLGNWILHSKPADFGGCRLTAPPQTNSALS